MINGAYWCHFYVAIVNKIHFIPIILIHPQLKVRGIYRAVYIYDISRHGH